MADQLSTFEGQTVTKTATSAVAAYRIVILSTDDNACEHAGAQYAWGFGISLNAAAAGYPVKIAISGIVPLQVDGNAANLSIGDGITVHDSTGYGQKAAGAASRPVLCQALQASTADGDVIPVLMSRYLTTA